MSLLLDGHKYSLKVLSEGQILVSVSLDWCLVIPTMIDEVLV